MRILFITTGSQATFYAAAPLATAARNAGHQVILAAHEPWVETAEAIGLPTFCFTVDPIRHFMRVANPGKGLRFPREMGDEEMLGQGRGFARMGLAGLESLLELAKDWPPDVVVGSSQSYSAMLLAAHLQVPYVRHIEYLGIPFTGIDPGAAEELEPELKRLGLDGLPEPDLLLDATPPSLRPSHDPPAQPMRWIPSNPQRRLERWMYTRPEGRRRVVITSGFRSLMFRDPGWTMPLLVRELDRLGAEVLIAASPGAAERFGSELGDARIGWIPLDVVAGTCDLAIHHGGATTATTFMANGVPQLIIPENPPEFPPNYHREAIAKAISGFGAAKMLWPQAQEPDKAPGEVIAAACREILADPGYAERAQFLAKEIASLPTPSEIVPLLEGLRSR
ncbi:glycosyltransferase [Thermomonospora catenispora]|uniref:glycosyltransferase n=1 Tax=Thermomonospora catenispora TaxID=2493090 RepID=UPI00111FBAB0|nr:nucleotide disphospho-sugar-binding domain-containing protein [Thermomonospora catenispora]TNY36165.1 glycosyltransferase [Thermomonospora catenispora]